MFDKKEDRAVTLAATLKKSLTDRNYLIGEEAAEAEAETKDESSNITHCDALLVVLTDNTFSANASMKIRIARTCEIPIVCR